MHKSLEYQIVTKRSFVVRVGSPSAKGHLALVVALID